MVVMVLSFYVTLSDSVPESLMGAIAAATTTLLNRDSAARPHQQAPWSTNSPKWDRPANSRIAGQGSSG
jgi:hypothetical protein